MHGRITQPVLSRQLQNSRFDSIGSKSLEAALKIKWTRENMVLLKKLWTAEQITITITEDSCFRCRLGFPQWSKFSIVVCVQSTSTLARREWLLFENILYSTSTAIDKRPMFKRCENPSATRFFEGNGIL